MQHWLPSLPPPTLRAKLLAQNLFVSLSGSQPHNPQWKHKEFRTDIQITQRSEFQTPNADGRRQAPREQNMSVIIIPDFISTNLVFHNSRALRLPPHAQAPSTLPRRHPQGGIFFIDIQM